jgi:threonine dehydratase/serine racemase
MMADILDLAAVRGAAARIAGQAHVTPVMTCSTLDQMAGRRLFFKCEQWQRVGAFKFRGACHAVSRLDPKVAPRGVVTHSSGNHAQALALAARLAGIPAHVVMPSNAPAVKRRAVDGYGAVVHTCEPTLAARESTAAAVLAETGGTFIHPYDNAAVIAGQGTAALELLDQVEGLDALITPVGGGGLLSGTCLAATSRDPAPVVFAAEPRGADDAARSLAAGQRILQTDPNTIADGLLTSLGELTWPIIRDHVERIVTVSDDQIRSAMELLWGRAKLLVEPSAATVLAAVLTDEYRELPGLERVGLVLSGGNVDLDQLVR